MECRTDQTQKKGTVKGAVIGSIIKAGSPKEPIAGTSFM